jgi:hypothetical protein
LVAGYSWTAICSVIFIIAHNHHRNFRARANLCDLIHGFEGGNGGLVVNGNNHVVGADTRLGGRAFRRNIIHHNPLQLIDPPPPCACSGAISRPLIPI